jgi:ribonuclease HI
MSPKKKPDPNPDQLDELLAQYRIQTWDYLLIGDGSARSWPYQGGWGCVLLRRRHLSNPRYFYGGMNKATNILAEMMAYIHPLMWIRANEDLPIERAPYHVHILTDCRPLVDLADRPGSRREHRELWYLFDMFRRSGLSSVWHWLPRDTADTNKFCHDLANAARKAVQGLAVEVCNAKGYRPLTPNTSIRMKWSPQHH